MSESEAIKAIFGDVIRDAVIDVLQELKPEEPERAKEQKSALSVRFLLSHKHS